MTSTSESRRHDRDLPPDGMHGGARVRTPRRSSAAQTLRKGLWVAVLAIVWLGAALLIAPGSGWVAGGLGVATGAVLLILVAGIAHLASRSR